jgi:hypothetical protein
VRTARAADTAVPPTKIGSDVKKQKTVSDNHQSNSPKQPDTGQNHEKNEETLSC